MPDLEDGEVAYVQGSAKDPYELKNVGGVYSCTCPAWRNQSVGIERRTCKHLRKYRGEEAESARLAAFGDAPAPAARATSSGSKPRTSGRAVKKETAPPVLLAHRWENDVDLTGWWMSEKLDGVRAWWDGERFLSRNGNEFHAPDWFVDTLPRHPLDGELWVGRKMFQETMSVVRRFDKSDDWKRVRYVLFDAPEVNGPFEARYEFLLKSFGRGTYEFCHVLEHERVRDMTHLKEELARIEGLGGEGLMVRKPGSKYVNGRSETLLKIKSFFDAEAKVVGHTPGTGRHKGRLGALDVVLPDGTKFQVGTGFSDAEREDPPPIGSVITFRYQELSDGGVPRFPSYVGIRDDVDWPESGATKTKDAPVRKSVNPVNPKGPPPGVAKRPKLAADGGVPAPRKTEAVPEERGAFVRRFQNANTGEVWEVELAGAQYTVRTGGQSWGQGTSETHDFGSPEEARRAAESRIAEMTTSGFVETTTASGGWKEKDAGAKDRALPPARKPAPVRKAADEDEDEDEDAEEDGDDEEEEEEGAAGKRYFEFVEGTSSKFWEIWVEGNEVFTRYGRIGSKGQTTVKDASSPAAAKKLYDKLVKEKTGKGYEEK